MTYLTYNIDYLINTKYLLDRVINRALYKVIILPCLFPCAAGTVHKKCHLARCISPMDCCLLCCLMPVSPGSWWVIGACIQLTHVLFPKVSFDSCDENCINGSYIWTIVYIGCLTHICTTQKGLSIACNIICISATCAIIYSICIYIYGERESERDTLQFFTMYWMGYTQQGIVYNCIALATDPLLGPCKLISEQSLFQVVSDIS